jgi:hypothetical protein
MSITVQPTCTQVHSLKHKYASITGLRCLASTLMAVCVALLVIHVLLLLLLVLARLKGCFVHIHFCLALIAPGSTPVCALSTKKCSAIEFS